MIYIYIYVMLYSTYYTTLYYAIPGSIFWIFPGVWVETFISALSGRGGYSAGSLGRRRCDSHRAGPMVLSVSSLCTIVLCILVCTYAYMRIYVCICIKLHVYVYLSVSVTGRVMFVGILIRRSPLCRGLHSGA